MDQFVDQSRLPGWKPVDFTVANFTKPSAGQPALLTFDTSRDEPTYGIGWSGSIARPSGDWPRWPDSRPTISTAAGAKEQAIGARGVAVLLAYRSGVGRVLAGHSGCRSYGRSNTALMNAIAFTS